MTHYTIEYRDNDDVVTHTHEFTLSDTDEEFPAIVSGFIENSLLLTSHDVVTIVVSIKRESKNEQEVLGDAT